MDSERHQWEILQYGVLQNTARSEEVRGFVPPGLPKVQAVNVRDSVYAALVSAILDGRLPQGTWLREAALANELGVSNTPVREAFVSLVHEGLAERLPGRGVRVAVLGRQDISEIYDLRTALECLAVRLLAETPHEDVLGPLRSLLTRMDEQRASGELLHYHRLHREWHEALVRASGSKRLLEAYMSIGHQVALLVSTTVRFPGKPERSSLEHWEILDAVGRGDASHATALMRIHIQQAKIELLRDPNQIRSADEGGTTQ